jgi:3,4-dihydroxy 2-butanone 4-phosphate synthase/GTP cyclohydrolase II
VAVAPPAAAARFLLRAAAVANLIRSTMALDPRALPRAAEALAASSMAIVIDEAEDAADVIAAGALVTADIVTFMACEARGLVCLALAPEQVHRLRLPPMAAAWDQPRKAFTVSIDAKEGITTGISAAERAHTIRVAVAPSTTAEDLVAPGHVFPLRARPPGHEQGRVEAALQVARAAGHGVGAALCEILDDEGELASAAYARALARRFQLPVVARAALGPVLLSPLPQEARLG